MVLNAFLLRRGGAEATVSVDDSVFFLLKFRSREFKIVDLVYANDIDVEFNYDLNITRRHCFQSLTL